MIMLRAENVSVRFDEYTILKDLSLSVEEGQWLMLVGPNGAGKSTMIGAITRSTPFGGRIEVLGKDILQYKPAQYARIVGVLAQHNTVGYAYTVEEVVGLGRYAHGGRFLSGKDDHAEDHIENALRLTGLTALRDHSVLKLSGGELQRTFLAQVIAQDPKLLILDEPANHLDLIYQKHIFSMIRDWVRQPGHAVISVVHDLSLARMFGTHAVLIEHGSAVASGPIGDVLDPERLNRVYGMDVYDWMRSLLSQWK